MYQFQYSEDYYYPTTYKDSLLFTLNPKRLKEIQVNNIYNYEYEQRVIGEMRSKLLLTENFILSLDKNQEFSANPQDQLLFNQLLSKYGLFAEYIYRDYLEYDCLINLPDLLSSNRPKVEALIRNYWKDQDLTYDMVEYYNQKGGMLNDLKSQLIRYFLYKVIHNTDWPTLNNKITEHLKPRLCIVCNSTYMPLNIPGNRYKLFLIGCCGRCKYSKRAGKRIWQKQLPKFIELIEQIPKTNEDFESLISRMPKNNIIPAAKIWLELGGQERAKKVFGSWFEALALCNALPGGIQKTARGYKCIAKSGNVCLSLDERRIDDWLFDSKIESEKEPYYPYHVNLNPNNKLRADWRVGEYLIEYFGMPNNETYAKKMLIKQELAANFKIKLLAILPDDLKSLNNKLKPLQKFMRTLKNTKPINVNLDLLKPKSEKVRNNYGLGTVSFEKSRNRWRARRNVDGKKVHVGRYLTEEEAWEALKKLKDS